MKIMCIAAALMTSSLLGSSAFAADEALAALSGEWRFLKSVNDGVEAEPSTDRVRIAEGKLFLIRDGKPIEGIAFPIKLDGTTNPKLIDIELPNGKLEGIYKIEAKKWTVCLTSSPELKQRPAAFESKPGEKLILTELEKIEE